MRFKRGHWIKRIFLIVGIVLPLLGVSYPTTLGAQSLQNLGPADFPSRVKAIVWADGDAINRRGGLCWGKWCVNFGSQLPIGIFGYTSTTTGAPIGYVDIKGLKCRNAVIGVRDCRVHFSRDHNCMIYVEGHGLISIFCPARLNLD